MTDPKNAPRVLICARSVSDFKWQQEPMPPGCQIVPCGSCGEQCAVSPGGQKQAALPQAIVLCPGCMESYGKKHEGPIEWQVSDYAKKAIETSPLARANLERIQQAFKKPVRSPEVIADIVKRYAVVGKKLMLKAMPPNSCIAASRLTVECLKHFGIEAEAVPVKFYVECLERKSAFIAGFPRKEREDMAREAANFVNHNNTGGTMDTHVIVLTKGSPRFIIDPSFDQFAVHRQFKDIGIDPSMLVIPFDDPAISANRISCEMMLVTAKDVNLRVIYQCNDNYSFRKTGAWEKDHLEPLIKAIVLEMVSTPTGGTRGQI